MGPPSGRNEDLQGIPFVGQAGKLADEVAERAWSDPGRRVRDRCPDAPRPPGLRDPLPQEIANCQEYLSHKIELISPRVICTLGNFATKLLRDDPTGITRVHGREEVGVVGTRAVRLYPLFDTAAALEMPAKVDALRADFHRIPARPALPAPPQPGVPEREPAVAAKAAPAATAAAGEATAAAREATAAAAASVAVAEPEAPQPEPSQLGLF